TMSWRRLVGWSARVTRVLCSIADDDFQCRAVAPHPKQAGMRFQMTLGKLTSIRAASLGRGAQRIAVRKVSIAVPRNNTGADYRRRVVRYWIIFSAIARATVGVTLL